MFPNELRDLHDTLEKGHKRYERDLTIIELRELYRIDNPTATRAKREIVSDMLDDIGALPHIGEDVATDVVSTLWQQEVGRRIADLALSIMEGSTDKLLDIKSIVEKSQEGFVPKDDYEEIPTDLDTLLEFEQNESCWEFNIPSLHKHVRGGKAGEFMIAFARPESGKTAFWVSMVASQGGFAWQKKNVHIFCNEEPAIRTQMRMLNACSNLNKKQILNGSRQLAKDRWNEIQSYIYTHDSVDMNMEDLNTYCKEHDVDILIIDQLDKVNITGKYNSSHEKLGEVYRQAREIAKRHDVLVVGLSQASAEAHGRERLSFNVMANSKTGKAAEADVIIGIGKLDEGEENPNEACVRQITISKNKLTGDHGEFQVQLVPTLSQFTSFT